MPDSESFYTPNKMYELKVKIKNLDYTNNVTQVVFTSSLSTAYQVVDITFLLDPTDVVIEEIFGGEPIKLAITLFQEQDFPGPRIDIDLLYLSSDFVLTQKNTTPEVQQKDRTYFTVTTLARKAYQTMVSLVNDVFIGTTLNDIISSLANSLGAKLKYDTTGQNTSVIDQVCIPPTTFYKVIKEYNKTDDDIFDGFLDQRFGLFSGTPGVFCQYDNVVHIKNLTGKLNKDQTFTVHQLSGSESKRQMDNIISESLSGTVFYTYSLIETDYVGNSKFADLASDINHIVKPKNTLAALIPQTLTGIARNYSLLYSQKNKKLFIDPAINRVRYYNQDTGYETESTQFESRFGRALSDLSSLSLTLYRNLPVLSLIHVGECVKFKPASIEYIDFEGKYILWNSTIDFQKEGPTWTTTAKIQLIRTNKKK